MLIYPVTDERQITESMKKYIDAPCWNSKSNKIMWEQYLKNGLSGYEKEFSSPMEAKSFSGLPNAYIEVAEFDCLRDEAVNYAQALQKNGIEVELISSSGTIHGYDIAEKSKLAKQLTAKRIEVLQKAFNCINDKKS
jgi:acetyl esterase/lipase